MTPEIKHRIEQIKNGEIPKGFKKTKTGVIPTSWKYEKLDSYLIQHHEVSTQNNQYPVLTSSRKGIFFQKQYYDKEVASEDNTGYNVVPRGYFTYRHMSDDEVFVFNINTICDKGIVSTLYPVFSVTNSINPYFLQEMLNNGSDFHKYARIQKQGGSRTYMYFNKLTKLSIPIPSLDEQKRIMEILSTQDKVIECYEKKIEQFKQMKKYYLQNMFPKRGETVPKIRFKGFTDPWEQRKVADVANRYDNLRIPVAANLRIPGTTPYYGANGIQDYVDGFTHEGEFVLVAEDGANDLKNYPVKCVNGRIWVNNHAHVLQSKPEMADNKFLAYFMSQADIESLLVGGGRAKLNAEVMMGIDLMLPSKSEQVAIGQYLTRLDHLITLHQRKLEEEKKKKKALQQLLLTGIVRTN